MSAQHNEESPMMAHPDAASAAAPADARRVVRLIHADAPLPAECATLLAALA